MATATRPKSILVVEDAIPLAQGIVHNLSYEGYLVECVHTGADAIQTTLSSPPDIIILDILLPDMSGLAVLEAIRASRYGGRVIILSAFTTKWDQAAARRLGANRYVAKPFDLLELLQTVAEEQSLCDHKLHDPRPMLPPSVQVDDKTHTIRICGEIVDFTPKEHQLLAMLVRADGHVLTRKTILRDVWHLPENIQTMTIETHVKQIRAKLKPFGLDTAIITVSKVGYRWGVRA